MLLLLICLLTFQCPAYAKSTRSVHLSEGDLEPVYVEPGFSTLIKFDSHPEPGLIGDQDGFKVEYLKNMVAIKPLITKGKTNLFLFTKDGQFNFQLIASKGRHDNVVYVQPGVDRRAVAKAPTTGPVPLEELQTKRVNKSAVAAEGKLTVEALSLPESRSSLVIRFLLQRKTAANTEVPVTPESFSIWQGAKRIKIENIYIEKRKPVGGFADTAGLILIRAENIVRREDLKLKFSPQVQAPQADPRSAKRDLQVSFSSEFGRK